QTTIGSGRSDAAGTFELAGLLPGRYELSTSGLYGSPRSAEPLVIELEKTDRDSVRLVVTATGTVRGRIIDEHGAAVPDAQIGAWLVSGKGYGRTRSNDDGEFELLELTPGSTRITASDGDVP